MELDAKVDRLRALLGELPSVLVAFSGGVDSSFLLRVAHDVLGERCLALTTSSPTTPEEDIDDARQLAAALGVQHLLVEANELDVPGYAENAPNRCYLCKDSLFVICLREAARRGLAAVLDGANVDDLADHRPGLQAAAEQGVRHPPHVGPSGQPVPLVALPLRHPHHCRAPRPRGGGGTFPARTRFPRIARPVPWRGRAPRGTAGSDGPVPRTRHP